MPGTVSSLTTELSFCLRECAKISLTMDPSKNTNQTPLQNPTPIAQSTTNSMPKKSGQISVHLAFGIIYALVFMAIIFGPAFFSDNSVGLLGPFSALLNGGFLLILLVMVLHVIFVLKENKTKNN